ncbi:hypothetical protein NEUTE2DRAFT_69717 [Neurospora tetrasperma FGSC 2509]|nr:hypothetical protein NEUTE2DRAFT_69717 [Neurospora tetrasperma FGSC 2509]
MDRWTLGKKACGVYVDSRAQVSMLSNAGVKIIDENQTVVDDQEEKPDEKRIIAAQNGDSCEDFAGVKAAQIYQQHAPVRIPRGRKRKKKMQLRKICTKGYQVGGWQCVDEKKSWTQAAAQITFVSFSSSKNPMDVQLGPTLELPSGTIQCHQGMP